MADDDREYSEEEEDDEPQGVEKKKEEPQKEISEAELAMEKMRKKKEEEEAMWTEYMESRKKQKAKEEEELRKLKEKQMKRKERRKEEEKKLMALKKQQEAQRVREMEEKKAREAEAKLKRLEEAERKRQLMQEAMTKKKIQEPVTPNFVIPKRQDEGNHVPALGNFDKLSNAMYARGELAKTKEELQADKKIALSVRVKPLQIEGCSTGELKQRAQELWVAIVRLESEKYDLEERRKRQEYDLKELSERQRQINRSKALKKGLDPDALSGKFPPMINVASKYERRLDRRSFYDKKSLYEGGYLSQIETGLASQWEDKIKYFKEKGPSRLLKWDPHAPKVKENEDTRQEEEEEDDDIPAPSYLDGDESEIQPPLDSSQKEEEEEEEEEDEEDEEEEEEEEEE